MRDVDMMQAPLVVMFARHGEKPGESGPPHGINEQGENDKHSLSPRGWTRAGALAALLSHSPIGSHPHLVRPERILATAPSHDARSRREMDTATPLGRRVSVAVEGVHGHGGEEGARQDILGQSRNTFVVWHHGSLAHFVRGFPIRNLGDVPAAWPDDRFDMIWVLRREPLESAYTFTSVDQRLLSGDAGVDA